MHTSPLRGRRRFPQDSVACWAPAWRAGTWSCCGFEFMVIAYFPIPLLRNPVTLRHPHSFCDLRESEIITALLGFCPPPPECLLSREVSHRSRLLKVPILHSVVYHFLVVSLQNFLPSPPLHGLSYDISPQIHFSTPPALQKLFTFLLVELQWFFSSSSDWIHVCSEWFNR